MAIDTTIDTFFMDFKPIIIERLKSRGIPAREDDVIVTINYNVFPDNNAVIRMTYVPLKFNREIIIYSPYFNETLAKERIARMIDMFIDEVYLLYDKDDTGVYNHDSY